jgi:hypothetical protein
MAEASRPASARAPATWENWKNTTAAAASQLTRASFLPKSPPAPRRVWYQRIALDARSADSMAASGPRDSASAVKGASTSTASGTWRAEMQPSTVKNSGRASSVRPGLRSA